MTTCLPRRSESTGTICRAVTSVPPPGGYETMRRIGRSGYSAQAKFMRHSADNSIRSIRIGAPLFLRPRRDCLLPCSTCHHVEELGCHCDENGTKPVTSI